jgi:siroheme synthase-like protein
MAFSFPVFFDLRDKPVLLLGGGFLAEEKLHLLRSTGARITVQAAELSESMAAMAARHEFEWRPRDYRPGDTAGFYLVFSAAGRETNAAAMREADARLQPFNAADAPEYCRFILPSVHRQGDLTIAVSTNGKCPAMAIRIREEIAARYGAAYGEFLAWAGRVRSLITSSLPDFTARRAVWHRLARGGTVELLELGRRGEAAREFAQTLEEAGIVSDFETRSLAS